MVLIRIPKSESPLQKVKGYGENAVFQSDSVSEADNERDN